MRYIYIYIYINFKSTQEWMKLLQRETRRVDALEFQKPPTEIDSPFNHEIHHFLHSQICKRCVTVYGKICVVMLDQTI